MAKTITILQDTREKKPLMFPETVKLRGRRYSVKVKKARLDAGDYKLEGSDDVIVERKASIRELHQNLATYDKRRMKKALNKLTKAAKRPILFVEGTLSELFQESKYCPDPPTIVQKLFDECTARGIPVWFVGRCAYPAKRRKAGELVLRALLAKM